MPEVRRHRTGPPSLVHIAHEIARLGDTRAAVGSSPFLFFLSAEDGTFDREALIRLAALGNMVGGQSPAGLCVYGLRRSQVDGCRKRLSDLAQNFIDPQLDLIIETLPGVPDGSALLIRAGAVEPPHLIAREPPQPIGRDREGLSPGDCWVFDGGTFHRAARAELDAFYATVLLIAATAERGSSVDDLKSQVLAGSLQPAMLALQSHGWVIDARRAWLTGEPGATTSIRGCADRVAIMGSIGLCSSVSRLWDAARRDLRSLYLLECEEPSRKPPDDDTITDQVLARFYLLGALAVWEHNWDAVSALVSTVVPGRGRKEALMTDHPYFRPGPQHSLQRFFELARAEIERASVWMEEFLSEEIALDSLCRFDLVASLASEGRPGHYPNFARFEKSRVGPLVVAERKNPGLLGVVLGERAPELLEDYLDRVDEEIAMDFATFASWWAWGHTFEDFE
ncbi:MAG: hypothetical protein ABR529_05910 [Actinomycetota bacterium]